MRRQPEWSACCTSQIPLIFTPWPTRQSQREGKILLVDDDPGLLRLLSIRLRAEGYEVEAVESAHNALPTLESLQPGPRHHRPAHGQDGRHRAAERTADALAGPARRHHHGARHDSGCRHGNAARRVRLPDQAHRQGRTHDAGRTRAEVLGLASRSTKAGLPRSLRATRR